MGYFLVSPLRWLYQNPEKILAPFIKSGMTVLEIGPGMGYFTLPMARTVGQSGRIVCVDIQERMLKSLMRRAKRAGVAKQIITRVASPDSLKVDDFAGRVDFVLAFAVVHEVPNQESLFREIHRTMKSDSLLLISEPTGHVNAEHFEKMVATASSLGFDKVSSPKIRGSISVVLKMRGISGQPQ